MRYIYHIGTQYIYISKCYTYLIITQQKYQLKQIISMQPQKKLKPIQYLVCLHLQATCDDKDKQELKPCQQVIQISAILVNTNSQPCSILGKFHQYVKPVCNPKLTPFCTQITGIKAQMLKTQPDIVAALNQLEQWLKKYQFVNPTNYVFATWGTWTIKSCLLKQLKIKKLKTPDFINSFADVRKTFFHLFKNQKLNVFNAAKQLKLEVKIAQNNTQGQASVQNLAQIIICLYNSKRFVPQRRFVTVVQQVPNVNVVQELQYLLVLDFQATCQDGVKLKPCSQIIEFPVMVVDLKNKKIINKFHQYVTPSYNPNLTPFCTDLTGITQQMVTNKLKLEQVLQKLDLWIRDQPYLHSKNWTFVTCGDWDLCSCLKNEAKTKSIKYEQYLKQYINIKKVFQKCMPNFDGSTGMMGMLKGLNIPHEGKHHSGIDDVHNICNICIKLLEINQFRFMKNHINTVK